MTDRRVGKTYRGLAILASLSVCSMCVARPSAAQARFDVLANDAVSGINELTIYTIRDNRTARCYTLFVLADDKATASNAPAPPIAPAMTAEQLGKLQTAQALRDAKADRDRHIMDLRARMSTMWTIDYAHARERIEDEYASRVGTVLPDLYSATQVVPGYRTTSREELENAVARAIAEGDSVAASAARAPLDQRLAALLERFTPAPRLAVSGPLPCATSAK